MVVPSVGIERVAASGEVDPLAAWSSWDRVRGVCGGVLCIDCSGSSPVVSLLFSGAAGRAGAEFEMCANNDEEDFENSEVNADVQEMTVDSEGCAQGAKLESLEDICGLPAESRHRSKLAKLPSDRDGLPAREDEDEE